MTFLNNLTLGRRIILLTTFGLVMGIGVLSFLGIRAVNQATEAMLRDRLTTARLVADHLDETLFRALNELEYIAQSISGEERRDNLEAQLKNLNGAYSRLSISTDGIYLVDSRGQVILSEPEVQGNFDLSSYPVVAQTLATGKVGISNLTPSPAGDNPIILLTAPVLPVTNVLAVAIDPEQSSIGGFIQPITLGQTGYVELVDQNGIVISRTEPGPKLSNFEQSDHSGRFASLIAAGKPARGVCHTCHEPQQKVERRDVLAFVPLSRASWGVVIRQSEDEALTPVHELSQSLLLFGIGLGIIGLMFVLITTRDIVWRISVLTTASRRIAKGDLTSPIIATGKDEIGVLAGTFDDMRKKLKSSYTELEQKTRELSSLLSVSEILNSTFELSLLLKAVIAKAVEVIPRANAGALLLKEYQGSSLRVECLVGLRSESFTQVVYHAGSRTSDAKAVKEQVIPEAVRSFVKQVQVHSPVRSFISADVSQRGVYTGSILMLNFDTTGAFSNSEQRLLQAIADYVALVMEKAQLSKEAEEARALHEADKLRSEFVSSVSHELRTPLTLIKGYSTSLLRQDTSWDEGSQREFLRIIDEKTDELRDLIDKLLESAKLEAGAVKLEKEPLLIPQLAKKVVGDISQRARKHDFVLNFAHPFPVVEADFRCLKQVLQNLIENAVKYSREGSKVIVGGEVVDGKIVVSVSDEGIGIPPEHQGKVFDRFYRVNAPPTLGTPGTGLGLAIVKGHVEAHGGKVWLESVAGKGSKFYFSLPLEAGNKESGGSDE